MRDLLDLVNEMSEDEGLVEAQDSFDFELTEDFVIETGVIDINEDGILIEGDEETLRLLSEHGFILEDSKWSKYDEPTVDRIKKGKTNPVNKTDYDKPAHLRKKEKKQVDEGAMKHQMETDAEKMTLKQFLEKYDPHGEHKEYVTDFYKTTRGEDEEVNEAKYQGRTVPLGKPMAGDVKKSKVYVKGPKGNVVKVNFGDKKMKIKKSNPKRRKSFRARHNCANPGPRWKARYWSCRAW